MFKQLSVKCVWIIIIYLMYLPIKVPVAVLSIPLCSSKCPAGIIFLLPEGHLLTFLVVQVFWCEVLSALVCLQKSLFCICFGKIFLLGIEVYIVRFFFLWRLWQRCSTICPAFSTNLLSSLLWFHSMILLFHFLAAFKILPLSLVLSSLI